MGESRLINAFNGFCFFPPNSQMLINNFSPNEVSKTKSSVPGTICHHGQAERAIISLFYDKRPVSHFSHNITQQLCISIAAQHHPWVSAAITMLQVLLSL